MNDDPLIAAQVRDAVLDTARPLRDWHATPIAMLLQVADCLRPGTVSAHRVVAGAGQTVEQRGGLIDVDTQTVDFILNAQGAAMNPSL